MEKWRRKYAVVTGTSAGIGVAIMKELAKQGVNVIALARREEKIRERIKEFEHLEGKIFSYKCDVSSLESIKETFKWIEETFGIVSILINNAGCTFDVPIIAESDEVTEKLNKIIDTNFTGSVHMTREAIKLIKKSEDYGMIININSVAGHKVPFGIMNLNTYAPSKFALTAFSEVLRQELITINCDKIRVTNLSPGGVKTEIAVVGGYIKSEEELKGVPLLEPDDIAKAITYLLSTPSSVNVTQLTISPVGEKF